MLHAENLKGLLVFLCAAGIVVPLLYRIRLGTAIAFLIVGAMIGPLALGRLAETHPWLHYVTWQHPDRGAPLADLGITFLLFLLGLELSLGRLWALRRFVLGVGALQVAACAAAIGLALRFAGAPPPAGLVLGLCLALSSTAIVMQLLEEQRRAASELGRIALSVLLFQDLMVVPILFVVSMLGGGNGGAAGLALAFVQAFAAVAAIMVAGRYVARPLLRSAARTGSRELLFAISLLIVIGAAVATEAAGLSGALGAFLAGLLLSETEYRHQIEVDIEPFKGLLLGIFFITVGAGVDLVVVWERLAQILAAVVALVAAKSILLYAISRVFGVRRGEAAELALLLSQGGEFAFVVIVLAASSGLITSVLATSATAVVTLSMLTTPVLAMFARELARRLDHGDHAAHAPSGVADMTDHVVIGGFGRVGQTIGRVLDDEGVPFIAFDMNPHLVAAQREAGRSVYFGDASHSDILRRSGPASARAFVVTLDGPGAAERMVGAVRTLRHDACVLARARDAEHASRLARLGAVGIVTEAMEASLQLAAGLLQELEVPESNAQARIAVVRRELTNQLKAVAHDTG